jgi:hypothetical protein
VGFMEMLIVDFLMNTLKILTLKHIRRVESRLRIFINATRLGGGDSNVLRNFGMIRKSVLVFAGIC